MSHNEQPRPASGAQPQPLPGHEPVAVLDAPPERLGLLLAEARTRQGLGLSEVAERIGSDLDATQLMALESGALEVDRSVIEELSRAYGVEPDTLVPPRSALIIDLNEGYLRAGPDIALLTDGAGRDAVLDRYLDMVWELRSVQPGTIVPLRGADIAALSAQLGADPEVLESQLRRMMTARSQRSTTKVLIGLAAAVLAVTGGVIAWQATGDDAPSTEPTAVQEATTTSSLDALPPAPTAQVGEAEVIERNASEVPGPAGLDALPPAPTAEIGDAATQERGASEPSGTDLESLAPAPTASVGDAAVQERNPDGSPGEQQTR